MSRSGKLWRRVHRGISLVLTVVWIGAGATKLAGLTAFRGVLETHDVLPYGVISFAWVLPVFEIALGGAIFVAAGQPLRPRLLRAGALLSALLLSVFCVYITRVDPEAFRTAGCGCAGAWGLTDLIGSPTQGGVIATDVVLTGSSLAMLVLPRSIMK